MTNEQMRVEFEAWVKERGHGTAKYPEDGSYKSFISNTAWGAWQAAILADRERRAAKDASAGEAEQVCAEAYQVVGSLLSDLGQFESDHAEKILDNLSHARMVHADVLPWPSFSTPPAPAAPVSVAASKEFDEWWDQSGQFSRAGGGDYEKTFAFNAWNAALAATQQAEPSAKYLVCTGVVHEGEETYTVHDKPVPLADNWKLYTAALAAQQAEPSAAEEPLFWVNDEELRKHQMGEPIKMDTMPHQGMVNGGRPNGSEFYNTPVYAARVASPRQRGE